MKTITVLRACTLAFLLTGFGTVPALGHSFFGDLASVGATDVYKVSCKAHTTGIIARVRDAGDRTNDQLSVTATTLTPKKGVGKADVNFNSSGTAFSDTSFVVALRTPEPVAPGTMTGLVMVTRIPPVADGEDAQAIYEVEIHCSKPIFAHTEQSVEQTQDE